jgi:hypothetical protein
MTDVRIRLQVFAQSNNNGTSGSKGKPLDSSEKLRKFPSF